MTSYKNKSFDFFFYINLHIICNLRLKNDQLNTNLLNFKNSRLDLMFSPWALVVTLVDFGYSVPKLNYLAWQSVD